MELYQGRPEDVSGREEREIRVYDLLDKLGIEYLRYFSSFYNLNVCNFVRIYMECFFYTNT